MDTDTHTLTAEEKLDAILASSKRTEQYFKWLLIGVAGMFLLPLVALLVVVPIVLRTYGAALSGVGY